MHNDVVQWHCHFSSCGHAAKNCVRKLQNDLTYNNQWLQQKASRTDKVKQGNGNSIMLPATVATQ